MIGQVLTESLVLAGLSGTVGVGLAVLGDRLLLRLLPGSLNIPRMEGIHLDAVVFAFAVLLTGCVALFFGMAPAVVLSRNQFARASSQRQVTEANGWRTNGLLVGEIAVALILLTGYVVMLRGFVRLANVDPGFRTAHILTAMAPSGRYFQVMGIPLLQGRLFSRFNSGMDKGAVVINRTMAEQYWPGKNAVGQPLSGQPHRHRPT